MIFLCPAKADRDIEMVTSRCPFGARRPYVRPPRQRFHRCEPLGPALDRSK